MTSVGYVTAAMLAVIDALDALDDLSAALLWLRDDPEVHVRAWGPGEYALRRRLLAEGPLIETLGGPRVSYRIFARV